MADIIINEVSQNYTYNIGTNSFATVAMPMTACWGPGFFDYTQSGFADEEEMLENTAWTRFPATQTGLESFVATFRGPAANYRLAGDYSYQIAMTLLTAGYDVLACRLCPGVPATGKLPVQSIGNNLVPATTIEATAGDDGISVGADLASGLTPSTSDKLVLTLDGITYTASNIEVSGGKYTSIEFVDTTGVVAKFVEDSDDAGNLRFVIPANSSIASTFTEGSEHSLSLTHYDTSYGDTHYLDIKAKYPGTFGNNLRVEIKKQSYRVRDAGSSTGYAQKYYWSLITSIIDDSGIKTSVENKTFVFEIENSTDNILHISEVQSDFLKINAVGTITDSAETVFESNGTIPVGYTGLPYTDLTGGTDKALDPTVDDNGNALSSSDVYTTLINDAATLARTRYDAIQGVVGDDYGDEYVGLFTYLLTDPDQDIAKASMLKYMEWLYTKSVTCKVAGTNGVIESGDGIFDLLKDKLTYNPNRVISPGWDDQNPKAIVEDVVFSDDTSAASTEAVYSAKFEPSPLSIKLMEVAYYSRCATALIDLPQSLERRYVYDPEGQEDYNDPYYAQALARFIPSNTTSDVNGSLFQTHSALFGPWGNYKYVGTSRQALASPSFLALMIQRAQILNQANQYEWALPTNRKHNLRIGKMQYNVPKKILDRWQKLDGVGVNVITAIPDLGTNIWGNSTLFEVPPATYQALANLSTRYLVNAVEDVIYKTGIGITFSYNNEQAYNKFYAGVTPILDTMKNVGAIEDYYVRMSADINGLDSVNANTVIGKVYLVVNGVINDIVVDLVALPAGTDLSQYRG